MNGRRAPLRALMLLAAASACTPDDPAARGPVVRDSAGIRIVETPADAPHLTWRVPDEPRVDIGGTQAAETHSLFQVASAVRLSDGRIVVANRGTSELRYYGAGGDFVLAVGRRGEGPGEFQQLTWAQRLPGDSIVTYDLRLLRFSVFDVGGVFVRSFRLATTDAVAFAHVIGMYADGSFLAQGFENTGDEVPSGLQRYEAPLYHFGRDGALLAELGMFSGNETYFEAFGAGAGFAFHEAFFPRYTYRVAAGDHLYVAANDAYELERYTPDGRLTAVIRRVHEPVAVKTDHVRRERARRLAAAPSDARQRLAGVLNTMPIPETFPAYHLVRADEAGNVWVQAYPVQAGAGDLGGVRFDRSADGRGGPSGGFGPHPHW